jgi:Ni/Fe-hydrogenase subunit HybB-like protein
MSGSTDRSIPARRLLIGSTVLVLVGLVTFLVQAGGDQPARAWQAYLINFLMWSAIAQGGLLFSMVMHLTRARWSEPMQNLAESFAAFFPLSFGLLLLLFLGRNYLFPWLHHPVHGQRAWLNLPFLFSRDLIGLLLLYGLGFTYLYYALRLKLDPSELQGKIRAFLLRGRTGSDQEVQACNNRMTVLSVLYILAYAIVLTIIAFDLVMSMEPPWYSTLFGPYAFAKAFYLGLAGLTILAAIVHLSRGGESRLSTAHFHDLGKLLFAFCLVWADFFYVQLLVIWYGNISEEAHYVIQRTMLLPWKPLAWSVFITGFVIPFLILISRKVKETPLIMLPLCCLILTALWFEHLLLVGPSLNHQASSLPLGIADGLITLGFLGLMVLAISLFLRSFPDLIPAAPGEMN